MRTGKFLSDTVSILALGSADFGGRIDAGRAYEIMDAYTEIGGNFIDTAHVYGDFQTPKNGESERVIGRWMHARHNRGHIFLSTKGAHPALEKMNEGRLSREDIRADIQESLSCLGCNFVDVFFLHRDDESRPVGDIMETMQGLIDDGFTRHIGASNWKTNRIQAANAYALAHGLTPFSANQPQLSLAKQMTVEDPTLVPADAEMIQMHRKTGMIMTPFSSQAKGFFTKLDALGEAGLSDKARRRFLYPENLEVYSKLRLLREKTGLSIGALALAWLTSQDFPVFPIVGASSPEQALAFREAGDAVLSKADRDGLRTLESLPHQR